MSIHNLMHIPAINDCPFCHKEGCVLDNIGRSFSVSCTSCGAEGPIEEERESAINYWNGISEDIDALRADCQRLRRELDECNGVIR